MNWLQLDGGIPSQGERPTDKDKGVASPDSMGDDELLCQENEQIKAHPIGKKIHRYFSVDYSNNQMCPICNMMFNVTVLIKHLETHAINWPFFCDECQRCYKTRSNLIKHMLSHGKYKAFKCLECGLRFHMEVQVRTHITSIHKKEEMYECSICNINFKSNFELHKHCLYYHNPHWKRRCEKERPHNISFNTTNRTRPYTDFSRLHIQSQSYPSNQENLWPYEHMYTDLLRKMASPFINTQIRQGNCELYRPHTFTQTHSREMTRLLANTEVNTNGHHTRGYNNNFPILGPACPDLFASPTGMIRQELQHAVFSSPQSSACSKAVSEICEDLPIESFDQLTEVPEKNHKEKWVQSEVKWHEDKLCKIEHIDTGETFFYDDLAESKFDSSAPSFLISNTQPSLSEETEERTITCIHCGDQFHLKFAYQLHMEEHEIENRLLEADKNMYGVADSSCRCPTAVQLELLKD